MLLIAIALLENLRKRFVSLGIQVCQERHDGSKQENGGSVEWFEGYHSIKDRTVSSAL